MYWANFLHIYQPAHQMPDTLERVVRESYLPLIQGLQENPRARITLNINGALTELLLRHEHFDIIDGLRDLAKNGQVEFTGSAKYHAFLPLIPKDEIRHQIELNTKTNKEIFGDAYSPKGFFPPEMAYDDKVAEVATDLGFEWMILDEITAFGKNEQLAYTGYYIHANYPQLKLFFRERRYSNVIMSAYVRSPESFFETVGEDAQENRYLLTGMDGETFGHHRVGLDKFLVELWQSKRFDYLTISQLPEHFPQLGSCSPVSSTWASTEKDIEQGIQFRSWKDPENPIHSLQWEFLHFVYERILSCEDQNGNGKCAAARKKMDEAFASDHFWWASAKPWWSIEMIEAGAWRLLDTLKNIPGVSEAEINQGTQYYHSILALAFEWQRTGHVRRIAEEYQKAARIPFKERTLEAEDPAERADYYAFIDLMRKQMRKAAEAEEFEKAILWRDAIWKIEHKNDIYDAIHATNLLRVEIPEWEIQERINQYKEQYRRIKPGQPEHRE